MLKTLSDCYAKAQSVTDPVLDALDDFSQCISSKENDSRFPEEYGPVNLSHEEKVFFEVWSAWTMACGGGATEALDCRDCGVLVEALREIGATEIIDPITRLDRNIREFEEEHAGLDWVERDEKSIALKMGLWSEDDQVFFEPEDRIPKLLIQYAIQNEARMSLSGFES